MPTTAGCKGTKFYRRLNIIETKFRVFKKKKKGKITDV